MRDIPLDIPLTCDGHWRLGNVEGSGRFTYDPKVGMNLVFSGPDPQFDYLLARNHGPLVIKGQTSSPFHEDVVFVGCYLTEQVSTSGETTATFSVNYAFVGGDVSEEIEQGISAASFTMTELRNWARPALPRLDIEPHPWRRDDTAFSIRLDNSLPTQSIDLGDASLRFQFFVARRANGISASFELDGTFDLQLSRPATLDAVLGRFIRPLENFITLGTGKVNVVRNLHVSRIGKASAPSATTILLQPIHVKTAGANWLVWPRGLFSLLDVRENLSSCIEGWFRTYERYRTVCDQLFYTICARPYLESYFLWVIQTVEGYHRLRSDLPQYRLARSEYRSVLRMACGAVPVAQRHIVRNALGHGNDLSLRERLGALATLYASYIPGILNAEQRDNFPRECAAARNAFAHHLPLQQNRDLELLYRYTNFSIRLMLAGLMLEAGFSEANVRHALREGASLVLQQVVGA